MSANRYIEKPAFMRKTKMVFVLMFLIFVSALLVACASREEKFKFSNYEFNITNNTGVNEAGVNQRLEFDAAFNATFPSHSGYTYAYCVYGFRDNNGNNVDDLFYPAYSYDDEDCYYSNKDNKYHNYSYFYAKQPGEYIVTIFLRYGYDASFFGSNEWTKGEVLRVPLKITTKKRTRAVSNIISYGDILFWDAPNDDGVTYTVTGGGVSQTVETEHCLLLQTIMDAGVVSVTALTSDYLLPSPFIDSPNSSDYTASEILPSVPGELTLKKDFLTNPAAAYNADEILKLNYTDLEKHAGKESPRRGTMYTLRSDYSNSQWYRYIEIDFKDYTGEKFDLHFLDGFETVKLKNGNVNICLRFEGAVNLILENIAINGFKDDDPYLEQPTINCDKPLKLFTYSSVAVQGARGNGQVGVPEYYSSQNGADAIKVDGALTIYNYGSLTVKGGDGEDESTVYFRRAGDGGNAIAAKEILIYNKKSGVAAFGGKAGIGGQSEWVRNGIAFCAYNMYSNRIEITPQIINFF